MKQMKRILSVMLTGAMVCATLVVSKPAEAKKSTYWMHTVATHYSLRDGKWEKTNVDKDKYDNKGRHTEHSFSSATGNKSKTVYKYKNGNHVKSIYYSNGKKASSTRYAYDKKGNMKEYSEYDAKGKLIHTTTITNDMKGFPCKYVKIYADKSKKKEITTIKSTYKSGKVVKRVSKHTADGETKTTTSTFTYYKNGNTHTSKEKGPDSLYEYEYDSKGRIIKHSSSTKYAKSETIYEYNKKGDTSKSVSKYTSQSGITNESTTVYSYKYDKNGNISECVENVNGVDTLKTVYTGYKKITVSK